MQEGPKKLHTYTCSGCDYLETEYWKDYLENDETDSGTFATCKKLSKHISSYWYFGEKTPDWCPFIKDTFSAWLDEIENFSSRKERLYVDFPSLTEAERNNLLNWLKAAHNIGKTQ